MLDTSARLLRLLSLFQRRRYWPGAELASKVGVTSRTLRRDVDKLRTLGYPIHSSSGAEGGYQLGAGSTMPPLLLDDDEAVAVALGLRYAAMGNIEGIEEASAQALAKMEQILPPRLARRVAALQSIVVAPAATPSKIDARTLSAIASACRDCEMLRFSYRDRAGASTVRSVEPHRLFYDGRRSYLLAWDAARDDWRTFRLDRIDRRLTLGERFSPRRLPERDPTLWWTVAPCRARVKLLASADMVAGRLPASVGRIEPVDGNTCWFETGASSFESLAMHLSLLGVDFEIEEPPELVGQVERLADRYRAAISTSSQEPRGRLPVSPAYPSTSLVRSRRRE
jgi:predicted DNA-binding transcriptional regulator YafY